MTNRIDKALDALEAGALRLVRILNAGALAMLYLVALLLLLVFSIVLGGFYI